MAKREGGRRVERGSRVWRKDESKERKRGKEVRVRKGEGGRGGGE